MMAAASSSTDVRDVAHSECRGVVLVAPWTTRCETFISARAGMSELLSLASEHNELRIEESSTSRRSYVVKVFVYSTLPPPDLSERFKTNAPRHVEGSAEYAMYFLSDKTEILKGMLGFRTMDLANLPPQRAPLLEEIQHLLAFVSSHSVGRQNIRSSGAALRRVGNMLPSLLVSAKRKRCEEILEKPSTRKRCEEILEKASTWKKSVRSNVDEDVPA